MISFLKLIRYKNLLMVLLTMVLTKYALIESFVSPSYLSNFKFVLLTISVLCITAGGYIINDIFDIETDKINKPNKVFIDVTISKSNAWRFYLVFTFWGIIIGKYLSVTLLDIKYSLIFVICSILLFIYSYFFKRVSLIGNLIISFLISLSILLVYEFHYKLALINENFTSLLLQNIIFSYIIFSFFTTLVREIIKDIEDINGDLKINAKTLPIVIGRKRANRVALGFSVLLLLFLIVLIREFIIEEPVFLAYSIVFLLIPIGNFIYKLYDAKTKKDYSYLSKLMKLIMFFGILSMLLFKLI
ncbi:MULTISPECIES: geranylgeranylglycerol-phosphate geranylgeranyltransferase [Tenacibaculum]|uniref:geranylgeranylglycerol-phosphate geranylgeranyltransferase n=1 Tax=Tenacibaculum TaxID=104267 RepID=UPI001F0A3AD6|nr:MULTISPECIES: geranylgeranylglycerol-phosphate geranylgeranyltransferase [Tenacibaculum]MCH3882057.1 geranylgeranylglycerol-phosphate geranylgeranyltransferase [Tenacibaculum aquimarinum]